jgi:hypothetical protein
LIRLKLLRMLKPLLPGSAPAPAICFSAPSTVPSRGVLLGRLALIGMVGSAETLGAPRPIDLYDAGVLAGTTRTLVVCEN